MDNDDYINESGEEEEEMEEVRETIITMLGSSGPIWIY